MKVGEGFAVCTDAGATLSVCNAGYGHVQVAVTSSDGRTGSVFISADRARALAEALNEAAKEEP